MEEGVGPSAAKPAEAEMAPVLGVHPQAEVAQCDWAGSRAFPMQAVEEFSALSPIRAGPSEEIP